jgi:hypothetical protein
VHEQHGVEISEQRLVVMALMTSARLAPIDVTSALMPTISTMLFTASNI